MYPAAQDVKRMFSFRSILFLAVALAGCYIFQGAMFALVAALGVVLGILATALSFTSKNTGSVQYSVRSLLVAMTAFAVLFVWHHNRFRNQDRAVAEIQSLGGRVEFAHRADRVFAAASESSRPTVDAASIIQQPIGPTDLRCLMWLTDLKRLDLDYCHFGNGGLPYLARLTNLEWLDLEDTQTSDAGLVHLKGLRNLESLILDGNDITDKGLVHLENLKRLKYLRLRNTKVTANGVTELQKMLPSCKIIATSSPN